MTLPPLTKTYCTRANITYSTSASVFDIWKNSVWLLKAALKNELSTGTQSGTRHANSVWTVVGSSDGVTAALDGVDRWGSTFDISKLVASSVASPHSWIILQNSTLGYQVLIDMNSASSSNSTCRIAATPTSVPFVLAGTATHSPPATTVSIAYSSSNADSTAAGNVLISSINTALVHYSSYTFTDDGQFYVMFHRKGNDQGCFIGGISLLRLDQSVANDLYPVIFFGSTQTSGKGWPYSESTSTCIARTTSGGTDTTGTTAFTMGPYSYTYAIYFTSNRLNQYDTINNKAWWWRVRVFMASNSSTAQFGYRGTLPDVYFTVHPGIGVSFPTVDTQTHITAGCFLIPFVGVRPILM